MGNKKIKYIAYYRVSTNKQSLGIDAQKTMVKNYLGDIKPLESFTEKESGKSDKNRPELQKALATSKKNKATLIIATLSRLSRDLHFITSLGRSKVNFVVCDMPDATPLTINIMGAIAQYERESISNRTKRALQEVKKQGKPLGYNNPNVRKGLEALWEKKRQAKEAQIAEQTKVTTSKKKAAAPNKQSKREIADQRIVPIIKVLRKSGKTWEAITKEINSLKIQTRQKGKWHQTTLKRVARRNGLLDSKKQGLVA